MVRASEGKLRSFAKDARGNVALLFAFSLIPLLIGVGVAVDYGRALIVRERMNDATDAAGWPSARGLASRKTNSRPRRSNSSTLIIYRPSLGTVGKLNVNFIGDEVIQLTVTVSGMVPTTFMQLANINSVDVTANTTINKKERNIELVLVLDTTGSMGERQARCVEERGDTNGRDAVRREHHLRRSEDWRGAVRGRGECRQPTSRARAGSTPPLYPVNSAMPRRTSTRSGRTERVYALHAARE